MTFLDSFSIPVIVVAFTIISLAFYEVGFRLGRWWQDRMPGEQEGPTGVLVGSLLALMAFLLAVTMGMAADRFDARRGMVLAEANAIGKAYLEADYLLEDPADRLQELLREYLPLRIASDDRRRSSRTSSARSSCRVRCGSSSETSRAAAISPTSCRRWAIP